MHNAIVPTLVVVGLSLFGWASLLKASGALSRRVSMLERRKRAALNTVYGATHHLMRDSFDADTLAAVELLARSSFLIQDSERF